MKRVTTNGMGESSEMSKSEHHSGRPGSGRLAFRKQFDRHEKRPELTPAGSE